MRRAPFFRRALAASIAGVALVSTAPRDAAACGGCFHSTPPPSATQTASVVTDHRMVLALSATMTTLWDQIQYAGDPADFAWVLPTRGGVVVGVGSSSFIDALDQATTPRIHSPALVCNPGAGGGGGGSGGGGCFCFGGMSTSAEGGYSPSPPRYDGAADTGVVITSQTTVGPYDVVQIHGTDEVSIVQWLRDHDYVIPTDIEPVLQKYVSEGFDFTAVRLHPGKGVQAMRPIRVSFSGKVPALPLRMVAAGVGRSVGIKLFVVGSGRWKTSNFPSFTVDPASLTWDFVAQRSDYAAQRDALGAKVGHRGFALEASIVVRASDMPPPEPFGEVDAGLDTDAGDAALDATADDAAESGAPGVDPHASDVEIAFGTYPTQRVTRLRADLSATALVDDLELAADDDQAVAPADVYVTKFTGDTAVCGPSGGKLAGGSPSSLLQLQGGNACSTGRDADGESPVRAPLYAAAGLVGLAMARRASRRR